MLWGLLAGIVVGWVLMGFIIGAVAWLLGSRLARRELTMLDRIALAGELREALDARQECAGGTPWRR